MFRQALRSTLLGVREVANPQEGGQSYRLRCHQKPSLSSFVILSAPSSGLRSQARVHLLEERAKPRSLLCPRDRSIEAITKRRWKTAYKRGSCLV
ncbi:hypothetical protein RIF29_45451 [Crotalaria pallida]|uniref:Uncharacterized protein n=1 Tax=Crotalaria pallida TaxID=3830 RepID=A0AAN9DQ34_CROPI